MKFISNMRSIVKTILRGKFIALNPFVRSDERLKKELNKHFLKEENE